MAVSGLAGQGSGRDQQCVARGGVDAELRRELRDQHRISNNRVSHVPRLPKRRLVVLVRLHERVDRGELELTMKRVCHPLNGVLEHLLYCGHQIQEGATV